MFENEKGSVHYDWADQFTMVRQSGCGSDRICSAKAVSRLK